MTEQELRLEQDIAHYLAEGRLLHLATVDAGAPWVCHVWYAVGTEPNMVVFTSNETRRHSREIVANPRVAGGIVASPPDGLGEKVRGLSFEGRADEATGEALNRAYEAYAARWPRVRSMFSSQDIEIRATPMRMYVVRFTRVVLFDEVNSPSSPRQELVVHS